MRLFFIFLFSLNFAAIAQDSAQVREIPDSCIFVKNATQATLQSVACLDNKFRVHMGCPINDFSLTIYDWWGKEVFFTNDINEDWIAYRMHDGEYFWNVSGTVIDNGEVISVQKTGYVTVIY